MRIHPLTGLCTRKYMPKGQKPVPIPASLPQCQMPPPPSSSWHNQFSIHTQMPSLPPSLPSSSWLCHCPSAFSTMPLDGANGPSGFVWVTLPPSPFPSFSSFFPFPSSYFHHFTQQCSHLLIASSTHFNSSHHHPFLSSSYSPPPLPPFI
jgi:hypothetical protein